MQTMLSLCEEVFDDVDTVMASHMPEFIPGSESYNDMAMHLATASLVEAFLRLRAKKDRNKRGN